MKKLFMILLCLSAVTGGLYAADNVNIDTAPGWREDFSKVKQNSGKRFVPDEWEFKGKPFTTDAVFDVADDKSSGGKVLRMVADKASGTFLREVKGVDLKKYPVMRWCWRVKRLPVGADGRDEKKDDQAIGVYVGTGKWTQESVAYRWETETPKNDSGKVSYGGGFVKVLWHALRNKEDSANQWYTESRDVRSDFEKAYGYVPSKFAVSVVCNSQNMKSISEAELAWVEFVSLETLQAEAAVAKERGKSVVADSAVTVDSPKKQD